MKDEYGFDYSYSLPSGIQHEPFAFFENGAFAVIGLMYDYQMISALKIKEFVVEGNDMENLFYNFIEEFGN